MTDFKPILIDQLSIMEKHERQAKNPFKARAYAKVLKGIKELPEPITTAEPVLALDGVGEKLRVKIREIFETGKLHQAEEVQEESGYDIANALLKIYGVGPVKAEELVRVQRIRSLDDLRARAGELLNEKQQIGLKYYDEFIERIPRTEMKKHEKVLKKALKEVDERFVGEIVGSFRREAPDSGDIDILVKLPASVPAVEAQEAFQRLVQYLYGGIEYITDTLALGPKKCMGVCRLKPTKAAPTPKHRRLDILLTPEEEYPYAVLYFTGSDTFNVAMRQLALERGYTMNEHEMRPLKSAEAAVKKIRGRPAKAAAAAAAGEGEVAKTKPPSVPVMKDEKDIFEFLGLTYVAPKKRLGEASLVIKQKQ